VNIAKLLRKNTRLRGWNRLKREKRVGHHVHGGRIRPSSGGGEKTQSRVHLGRGESLDTRELNKDIQKK